jgi:hypothetical protein
MRKLVLFTLLLGLVSFGAFAQNAEVTATKEAVLTEDGDTTYYLNFERPNQVQRYFLECSDATKLHVSVMDCCMDGDQFEATLRGWDAKPCKNVTMAPEDANKWSPFVAFENWRGGPLRAMIEIRYPHGVNVFPAGAWVKFDTNNSCVPTIMDLGLSEF